MNKPLAVCLFALAIATAVHTTSTARVAAQQPNLYWTVIIMKFESAPGRPLTQLSGPFPSAITCQATLTLVIEELKAGGLEPASQTCRNDVTITLP